ncbi:hypothetical protein KM176_16320 [Pseudooceanicola sp. CBS1P-1]|uniref:Uncharacterized protein n=1 Tax=Pseudooceanicola albus TaxID=2692189 RepID=A0A6L7G3W6_9RHOB|nr:MULTISPECIES: hypothetical protein [Pseudooceanicola]MBT9385440.1 hypothetical protein [Pseudooceanicola endophyticus]MXN18701.1 hypothetical protein [Pseudooceanicola albus]
MDRRSFLKSGTGAPVASALLAAPALARARALVLDHGAMVLRKDAGADLRAALSEQMKV